MRYPLIFLITLVSLNPGVDKKVEYVSNYKILDICINNIDKLKGLDNFYKILKEYLNLLKETFDYLISIEDYILKHKLFNDRFIRSELERHEPFFNVEYCKRLSTKINYLQSELSCYIPLSEYFEKIYEVQIYFKNIELTMYHLIRHLINQAYNIKLRDMSFLDVLSFTRDIQENSEFIY